MTEYRKITADDLPTDGTFATVEEWSPATGEWITVEARVARMSNGSEVISTRYPSGGSSVGPKSHGIIARVPVDPWETGAPEKLNDRHGSEIRGWRVDGHTGQMYVETRTGLVYADSPAPDIRACIEADEHVKSTRHRLSVCPFQYDEGDQS